jgi:hypothetical protein
MTIFRCRIGRETAPGVVQTLTYIGPFESIPAGWSMVMRRVVNSRKSA